MRKLNLGILIITICAFAFVCGCVVKGAKRVKYDNGLTAVLRSDKNSLTASVAVYVSVGSVNEKQPGQSGLSHFIEHLMFKGSKNYPGDEFSRRVENMGGYLNAATSVEYTFFYVDIQKDGVEETVKMLADTLQNPLFPEEEIDRERKVVIEEIQRTFDNPFHRLDDIFGEALYEKSALKNSVIGTEKVISSISREEIFEYYGTHYIPENMTVVVCGNFDEEKIKTLIGETFGKFEKKSVPQQPLIIEEVKTGKETVKRSNVEVGYMFFGFLGPDASSDDIFAADLAAYVLGGGKSSRLYRVLKEEKQLVYSIGASFQTMKGTGALCISAVFEPANYEKIKEEITAQIDLMTENGISEEESARAKLAMKTGWSFSFEKPFNIGYAYGMWQIMGRPEIAEQYIEKISALTADDARLFLKKYYKKDAVTSAALLPEKK